MRDDFPEETKRQLARRVGYYCSFPTCGTLTIGPSEESNTATSSIGVACHIAAASAGKGSRRFNDEMTSEQRKDISNGIWMCNTHGKLIDTDETRFSVSVLEYWKTLAEKVASTMVEKGCDYKTALSLTKEKNLATNDIQIQEISKKGLENELIGNAIHDSCIPILWGNDLSESVRDYVIEHARNTFTHGNATLFELNIKDNKLVIIDDGKDYNPRNLFNAASQSGGTMALTHLLTVFGNQIIFATERINSRNQTTISTLRNPDDIFDVTPCSVAISFEDFHNGNLSLTINETCKEMYVILPRYFAFSDVVLMPEKFPQFQNHGSSIIFIGHKISLMVSKMIEKSYPGCHIIILP